MHTAHLFVPEGTRIPCGVPFIQAALHLPLSVSLLARAYARTHACMPPLLTTPSRRPGARPSVHEQGQRKGETWCAVNSPFCLPLPLPSCVTKPHLRTIFGRRGLRPTYVDFRHWLTACCFLRIVVRETRGIAQPTRCEPWGDTGHASLQAYWTRLGVGWSFRLSWAWPGAQAGLA
jgi:hypothetical protein